MDLFAGYFDVLLRDSSGEITDRFAAFNGVTLQGINDALGVIFNATTQRTAWYMGLISETDFEALSPNDTAASHAGWIETTGYTGDRKQWTPLSVSNGVITNTSKLIFAASETIQVRGIFLATVATKSSTSGILWATAAFATAKTRTVGQSMEIDYRLRGAGGSS